MVYIHPKKFFDVALICMFRIASNWKSRKTWIFQRENGIPQKQGIYLEIKKVVENVRNFRRQGHSMSNKQGQLTEYPQIGWFLVQV